MRPNLYWLFVAALLLGCEPRRSTPETAAAATDSARQVPAALPRLAAADTLTPFPPLGVHADSLDGLPVVRIDGQLCRVRTTGQPDRKRPLVPLDSLKGLGYEGSGYEARYTVQVLGPDGRPRSTSVLRKQDFAAAIRPEMLIVSVADAPELVAYLPEFGALLLRLWFGPGTDDAESALLLLDVRTGRLREVLYDGLLEDDYPGTALTPDGRTLLTRSAILHADGRRIELGRQGLSVPAVQLLSDSAALVVYEEQYNPQTDPDIGRKPHAAYLVDLQGRQLARIPFTAAFTGYLDGATLNYRYLRPTRTHYFYDDGRGQLLVVPRRRPRAYRVLPLPELPRFRPPRRPAEVRLNLSPDIGDGLLLYVDTLSGALRVQPLASTAAE